MTEKGRLISLERAEELKAYSQDYEEAKRRIPKGTDPGCIAQYNEHKKNLLEMFHASEEDWNNWKWQMANRVDDPMILKEILGLSEENVDKITEVGKLFRWAVTPYYLALIDPENMDDPIKMLSIPAGQELDTRGKKDPMGEEFTNPAGIITRRYPDRLILNTTNSCAMFCRHCQRRREIGGFDTAASKQDIDDSIEYIRRNKEIRDVLITGGDPLTLSDDALESIISRIRAIEHVEIIRIGTRTLVTMPQRVTPEFVQMLKKYPPLFINTQFNHPKELTPEAIKACNMLAEAGIPLGNQMVLLKGINSDKFVVRLLNHEMLKARVRPYYIFHAKQVIGTTHFCTSVDEGLDIMDHLRGYTSGMAIPTYIINAPGGLGKVPILPNYIEEKNEKTVVLRTWEGKHVSCPNQPE